jgi:hypothetical protein
MNWEHVKQVINATIFVLARMTVDRYPGLIGYEKRNDNLESLINLS